MNSTRSNSAWLALAQRAYGWLIYLGGLLQPVLLLGMRLYWGWGFFMTGKGKLENFQRTTEFFTSLGLPFPKLNVVMAAGTECFGGLLLLIGLGSRLISIPLAFTMVVAFLTADREALAAIGSDPDKFVSAAPFLFLLTCLVVIAFGPGAFSVDHLLARFFRKSSAAPAVSTETV